MEEDKLFKKIFKFLTNRLLIMAVVCSLAFYQLAVRLFDLQIVNGESYLANLTFTTFQPLEIPAPRGTIYDKHGRPLAVNESAFTLRIDPSIRVDDLNTMLYNLIKVMEENDQPYVDDFPISMEEPYTYLFNGNTTRENLWKSDMTVSKTATAPEAIKYLREHFSINPEMSNLEARKLLALRSSVYMQRYAMYNAVTVAYNVNEKTMIAIEEQSRDFPGVYVDVESLRIYPLGEDFAHTVGSIGKISQQDWTELEKKGYNNTDLVGISGIERAFEDELRGQSGQMLVEINNVGRRVRTVNIMHPIQGNKIFLTVDAELQRRTYEILENTLVEILKNKLQGKSPKEAPITLIQFFSSMMKSNNISAKAIMEAEPETISYAISDYVFSIWPEASAATVEDRKQINQIIAQGLEDKAITPAEMLIVLLEQEIITADEELAEKIREQKVSVLTVILDKLTSGEITPQMTNLDPCTGSVVVVDTNDGSVLASVSYPTFDTNRVVNNVDNDYFYKINSDPTTPQINRAFMESRAPGSTFKMITALAGLAHGAITTKTGIYDYLTFTKAGAPYTKCHASYSHGTINVSHALEVSCNYFFCDVAYMLGNSKDGTAQQGLIAMEEYMDAFGLNDRTGVEIDERRDYLPSNVSVISSPEYREYLTKLYNPDATVYDYAWYDGDTVRTAYGQGDNDYTAASMAKYVATLASGGNRYQMHFLDKIERQDGELVRNFETNLERTIEIEPEHLQAVYDGMILVTEGSRGTATTVFSNFPVRVAGKTGTAQEKIGLRNDHSSFAGFAPYEDPQIAIYVVLPFGDTKTLSAPATQVAKSVIAEYLGLSKTPEYANINTLAE